VAAMNQAATDAGVTGFTAGLSDAGGLLLQDTTTGAGDFKVINVGQSIAIKPFVSANRKYVTLEVQPTVATLMRPIRTFETNLSGLTTPVVIELPELEVKSAATTVKVPDNGYLVIGGFKHISTVDRRSETPILSNIPILSFFFSKKGRSDELRDLLIVLNVRIVDLAEQESQLVN